MSQDATATGRSATSVWQRAWADSRVRTAALTAYYLGIALALAWLYGAGGVEPPTFVYQGF